MAQHNGEPVMRRYVYILSSDISFIILVLRISDCRTGDLSTDFNRNTHSATSSPSSYFFTLHFIFQYSVVLSLSDLSASIFWNLDRPWPCAIACIGVPDPTTPKAKNRVPYMAPMSTFHSLAFSFFLFGPSILSRSVTFWPMCQAFYCH